MRIAFTGKGGSGKSTLSSLFSLWAKQKTDHVLAIDADLNQHLAYLLKLPENQVSCTQSLSEKSSEIKEMLRGNNAKIPSSSLMTKTSPPAAGSRFISPTDISVLFPECVTRKDNLSLIQTGAFNENDLGVNCYHSKTGIVEIILNHLLDKNDDLIVADMTAGVDAFASPLLSRFDLVCLVIEPNPLSIKVYEQFKRYQQEMPFNLVVGINKIRNEKDLSLVTQRISDPYIVLPNLENLNDWLFDTTDSLEMFSQQIDKPFNALLDKLKQYPRNWPDYWQKTVELHKKNSLSWANNSYGTDLTQQIDHDFLDNFNNHLPTLTTGE